jgi:hypothetical protein
MKHHEMMFYYKITCIYLELKYAESIYYLEK